MKKTYKKTRPKRNFFEGKKCTICHKPADFYRLTEAGFAYLCDKSSCEINHRERIGMRGSVSVLEREEK